MRNLRRSPATALTAILTLALTLGASVSIFSVVDAVLLTPPPFADPDSLFVLGETPAREQQDSLRPVTYATMAAWQDRVGSLAAIEAFDGTNLTLTELGPPERLGATRVTPKFLSLLGVTPLFGRLFDPSDVGQPVVIVGEIFWRTRLASAPNTLGHTIVLGNRAHAIVGVLPERFSFSLDPADLWLPLSGRRDEAVRAIARVADGVSRMSLVSMLEDVSRESSPPARVVATAVAEAMTERAAGTLRLLAAAVVLAMAIAFTNLAGLFVVRSIDRRRELAVRSALGAPPSEIVRQLLLEAVALVALGTIGGVLLAWWTTPLAAGVVLQQAGGVSHHAVAISWRMAGFIAILASMCAAICGTAPALMAVRAGLAEVLRRGATPVKRELALRKVLVAGQVALAFVLLAALTLLAQRLVNLLGAKPGFDPRNVTVLHVALPAESYQDSGRVASFYSTLQDALEQRLGVGLASVVDEIPLDGNQGGRLVRTAPAGQGSEAIVRSAGSGYFSVMQIPIVAGREFGRRDNAQARPQAIVSRALAERLFGSASPLGHRIWVDGEAGPLDIVGVAGDVRQRSLDDVRAAMVYVSALQSPSASSLIVARSVHPVPDVVTIVREEVRRLDPRLPVYGARSMEEIVAASPGVPTVRVLATTFGGFGVLAVVLGAIGLFGIVAHDVAARRLEFAIRMALGAGPARILAMILGQGAVMIGSGLVAGAIVSIWVAGALSRADFGTGTLGLVSVAGPSVVLATAGLAAVLPAARNAATTIPLIVMRSQ